jgi:hypothetical protein
MKNIRSYILFSTVIILTVSFTANSSNTITKQNKCILSQEIQQDIYFKNEFQNLNENKVPDGWTFYKNIGNVGFNNGKLYAYTIDSQGGLSRKGMLPSATKNIQLNWESELSYTYWGMFSCVKIYYTTDKYIQVHQVTAKANLGNNAKISVLAGTDPVKEKVLDKSIPQRFGIYNYEVTLNSNILTFKGSIAGELIFEESIEINNISDYKFSNINNICYETYTTTDNNNWIDNLSIKLDNEQNVSSSLIDGLVSYWNFDEGTGTNVSDNHNDNDAKLVGISWDSQNKKMGNFSVTSTNRNQRVILKNDLYLSNQNSFSASFWIKPVFDNSDYRLILTESLHFDFSQYYPLIIALQYGDNKRLNFSRNGVGFLTDINSFPEENVWYHIAVTANDVEGIVYINGSEVKSGKIGKAGGLKYPTCLFYHSGNTIYNNQFKGNIDEVGLWDKELSAEEIKALYNNGNGLTYPFDRQETEKNELVLHYSFDENANDISGNNNHGQINGTPTFVDTDYGKGIYFNNPSGYSTITQWIQLPNSASITGLESSSFTINIRYKTTDKSQINGRLCGSIYNNSGIVIDYNAGDTPSAFAHVLDGSNNYILGRFATNAVISDGNWHNQTVVVNRQTKTISEFIDGKLIDEIKYTTLNQVNFKDMVIGASRLNDTYGARLTTVDDFKIFRIALNSLQVVNLINGKFGQEVEIAFTDNAKPFINPLITANSKSYFYYNIMENEYTPTDGMQCSFTINAGNFIIPTGIEYIGNGILKCWIDLTGNEQTSNMTFTFPDKLIFGDVEYVIKNKPLPIYIDISQGKLDQNIDIFAGLSAGAKIIVGGVAAGPSLAAASISLTGTGGMGLNFQHDNQGREFITRRFEAGVGLSLQAPETNAVFGKIQAGINAGINFNGIVGQTMYFPDNLNSDISKKAKAAFILETFTLGGIELSPYAAIVLIALKNSLIKSNEDLSAVFSDLYYSNQHGLVLEGEASYGFTVSAGETDKDEHKLSIVDFGGSFTSSYQNIYFLNSNDRSLKFNYAKEFDFNALQLRLAKINLGTIIDFKFGTDFSLGVNYNPIEGINQLELSFGATPTKQLWIGTYTQSSNYSFILPKNIIQKNQDADNIIGSVTPTFLPTLPKKNFKVGIETFINDIDNISNDNPVNLDSFNDHIVIQQTNSSTRGLDLDVKVGLNVAIGVGGGLDLGIHCSYLDEMTYPKKQYIVAQGKIMPIAEYSNILDEQRLFSIQDELSDIFQGTVLLIKEQLNDLIDKGEKIIENGKEFVVNTYNGVAKLTGKITGDGLRWVTRISDPTSRLVQKSAFLEPKVINAYSSRRIIRVKNKSASLIEEESSVMYVVSENVNISLLNSNDEVINEFQPVTLSIVIDNEKMKELSLGENEKHLAKMYQYDAENLVWVELAGDSNPHIDTVSAFINKSASYTIGIELNSSNDITAPDIKDFYPKDGEIIKPVTKFYAQLYESPTGVGIDFSQTVIKIDNQEVSAVWNPIENIISFESSNPLTNGLHTFEVVVSDYNGNKNSVKSSVTVDNSTFADFNENIISFNCYPVPVDDILNIEINSKESYPIFVSIYNQIGQVVSNTFECQPVGGYIKVQWDRTGMNNQKVKSGIYFVRVKQQENIMVKKILLK